MRQLGTEPVFVSKLFVATVHCGGNHFSRTPLAFMNGAPLNVRRWRVHVRGPILGTIQLYCRSFARFEFARSRISRFK